MYKTFRTLLAAFLLVATPFAAAQAQVTETDTLPIEMHMLYLKLLDQTPDYNKLIYSNPEFQSSKDAFGQEAILSQQFRLLQKIYSDSGTSQPIYITKDVMPLQFSRNARIITFQPISPVEPTLYHMAENDIYGLFVRNGDVIEKLSPPYEFDDFISLGSVLSIRRGTIRTQFILEPVAADNQPFPLENGDNVNVILADLIEIKLIDEASGKLLLHKKFNDNSGLPIPVVVPTNRDYMPLPPITP